jgi:gluconolactonase
MALVFLTSFTWAQSPVPAGAAVEKIADGFQFVEGPVWNEQAGLLFSDIPANTVYQITVHQVFVGPGHDTASSRRSSPFSPAGPKVYLKPSGNSNGLAYDGEGRLLLAQTGLRRIARLDSTGAQTSLAALYGGKRLNSPNDMAVKSDGSIFFTDPPFDIPEGEDAELGFAGIYRITPSGALQLLDSSLSLPNGICFSPDETKLFVAESEARLIYVWDVRGDSVITNKRRFASISPPGYADGMKMDTRGNLFCTGPLGVWVFAPDGEVLDTILVPGNPTNCGWGEPDRKTLYITAAKSLYRIRLETTGVRDAGSDARLRRMNDAMR